MERYRQEGIDHRNYLQSLLVIARNSGVLSEDRINEIQSQLFDVLEELMLQNQSQGTGQISIDRMEQMLSNICYQISFGLKLSVDFEEQMCKLKACSMKELFYLGHTHLEKEFVETREAFELLKQRRLSIDNKAYEETLMKGIPDFFKFYNVMLKATELPGSFDYPLCKELTEVTGLCYVKEYLMNLRCEEAFCHLFEELIVKALLNGYSKESRRLSVNVFELLLANVIGNVLLDKKNTQVLQLNLSQNDRHKLEQRLQLMGLMELEDIAKEKIIVFFKENGIKQDSFLAQYTISALPKLIFRCNQNVRNHTLDHFFISLDESNGELLNEYAEEERMPTEMIECLIDELKKCRFPSDKIHRIRNKVRNMEDLIIILSECVYGEEANELFLQLSNHELAALMVKVLRDSENIDYYHNDDAMSWHMELLMSISLLDKKRQDEIHRIAGELS